MTIRKDLLRAFICHIVWLSSFIGLWDIFSQTQGNYFPLYQQKNKLKIVILTSGDDIIQMNKARKLYNIPNENPWKNLSIGHTVFVFILL